MFYQQAVRQQLEAALRKTGVNLSNQQDIQRRLARMGSVDNTLSTIDLSSASDTLSHVLFKALFPHQVVEHCEVGRCDQVLVKGVKQKAYMYASMGNATTFPVQSLVFLTLCVASYCYDTHTKPSIRALKDLDGQVRVFGDDIILPSAHVDTLRRVLSHLHLKVNPAKTFTGLHFRESCGMDAFGGYNVSTVSVLENPQRSKPGTIASTVSIHHNLCDRGYFELARYMRKRTHTSVQKNIRTVAHGSGLFGWSDLENDEPERLKTRWNARLHVSEVRCLLPKAKDTRLEPDTNAGLLQFFTERSETVSASTSSIGAQACRSKLKLQLGWATRIAHGL